MTTEQFKERQRINQKRTFELRRRITPAEREFKSILDELNVRYMFQKGFIMGFHCIVDFYLPSPKRICIEIDGEYHNTDEQKEADLRKSNYLTKQRHFTVIRFTNKEVLEDRQFVVNKMKEILSLTRKERNSLFG